jgi:Spy/CpxP family protein refolding chaperone
MATTKAKREAAALFFVVFLLGVLLGGVGVHLWGERVLGGPAPVNANPTRAQVIAQCTHELQLTPDQQKQMVAIIDDTRAKWTALYSPLDSKREQIRLDGRAHIRAILTPEQQVRFDDFMRRIDEQRKKDAERQAAATAAAGH